VDSSIDNFSFNTNLRTIYLNKYWLKEQPGIPMKKGFSGIEILLMIISGIFLLFILLGIFLGQIVNLR